MKKALSLLMAIVMIMPFALTSFADTKNVISLGADSDTGIHLENSLLKPGEEYRFPINVALDEKKLTEEILKDHNFKISNTGTGKSLDSIKLAKIGGIHYLDIVVKSGYTAKQTEEEYALKLTSKTGGKTVGELKVSFMTGYKIVDDAVIDSLSNEEEIIIDNDAPVYAAEQLEKISKINNYKKVTFTPENDNWSFSVNVTDMPSINMSYNNRVVPELLEKYPNHSFEFLAFPANTVFKNAGTLEFDVSSMSESFMQKFYVYRYDNGKLIKTAASYNHEDDMLTVSAKTLGHFVITDKEISNTTVVTPPSSGDTTTNPNPNPNTGAAV